MHSFLCAGLTLARPKQLKLCTCCSTEPQNGCGWKGSLEVIWSHVPTQARSQTAVSYCYMMTIFHSSHRTQCSFKVFDVTMCLLGFWHEIRDICVRCSACFSYIYSPHVKKISSSESKLLGTFLKVWMPTCTAYACFEDFIYVTIILYHRKKPQLCANTTQN